MSFLMGGGGGGELLGLALLPLTAAFSCLQVPDGATLKVLLRKSHPPVSPQGSVKGKWVSGLCGRGGREGGGGWARLAASGPKIFIVIAD